MDEDSTTKEDPENLGTGLHVMYIMYDEEKGYPEVDLGDISPYLAASMFQSILDSLEMILPAPRVSYRGNVIMEPYSEVDEEIEDE